MDHHAPTPQRDDSTTSDNPDALNIRCSADSQRQTHLIQTTRQTVTHDTARQEHGETGFAYKRTSHAQAAGVHIRKMTTTREAQRFGGTERHRVAITEHGLTQRQSDWQCDNDLWPQVTTKHSQQNITTTDSMAQQS